MKKILIVVDMQNDFVTGSLKNEQAVKIIDNIKRKIESYKKMDGIVLFTKDTHNEDYLSTAEGKKLPVKHCIKNTYGHEIVDDLKPYSTIDNTIIKYSFGFDGWSEVINNLQLNDFEIELVGVCTDICVVSNAIVLKTLYPEVKIVVDSSCCAGTTIQNHKDALNVLKSCQVEVL